MERRTIGILAAVVLLLVGSCGGLAWFAVHKFTQFLDGDGLTEIDDPRPARAVVELTDDAGLPIAGARVDAYLEPPDRTEFDAAFDCDPASDPTPAAGATSGADGVATLEGLGRGDWVLAARAAGRATGFARMRGAHAAHHVVPMQLGVARSLAGRVSDGDPVAGAVVLACGPDDPGLHSGPWLAAVRARTGPQGDFVLDGLASGVAALWVVRPGDVPVDAGRALVPVCASIDLPIPSKRAPALLRPTDHAETATSAPPARGVRIRGHVTSEGRSSLAGACVEAVHRGAYDSDSVLAWTNAAADGAFELIDVPRDAKIALRLSAPDHWQTTTLWGRADQFAGDSAYRLERCAGVRGTVTAPGGAPPRDVRLWIYRLGENEDVAFNGLSVLWAGSGDWPARAPPTSVGVQGRFETTWGYAPARLVAYATADGYAPTVSAPFEGGAGPVRVEIELDPGVTLRCRVLGPDGAPVAGRPVRIRPAALEDAVPATAAVTDEDGRFAVAHVPARPVVVDVGNLQTHEFEGIAVTPAAGEIEVRLSPRKRAAGSGEGVGAARGGK